MVEIVLAISNVIIVISILVYVFFKDSIKEKAILDDLYRTHDFVKEMNGVKDILFKEVSLSKDRMASQNFKEFLNHINKLEEMTLPKPIPPITKGMVDDIMLRTPPLSENDIEKDVDDINKENFMDVFSKIPIDENTQVMFENEIQPEQEIVD